MKLIIKQVFVFTLGCLLSIFFLFTSSFKTGTKADIISGYDIVLFYIKVIIVTVIYLLIYNSKVKNIYIILIQLITIGTLSAMDDYYLTNLIVCVPVFFILQYFFLYRYNDFL